MAGESAPATFGRAKRCILLFLTGGPPQHDTFDPKPTAPDRIRGELKPIDTAVPGIQISELLPKFARQADKCCIVRSVAHGDRTHTSAGYSMLTGVPHPSPNVQSAAEIRPSPNDHPHLGSLLAKVRPPQNGAPVFASLPEIIKDDAVNVFPGQDAGFLGSRFGPFRIEANAERTALALPDVFLPQGITGGRLADRRLFLEQMDGAFRSFEPRIGEMGGFYAQAFELLRSEAVHRALDLAAERPELRESYGGHLFGQGCLLARRLVEAGVALVTVYWHYEGPRDSPVWDTHQNNYAHLRKRLAPPTDQALAALLSDLGERGMLADTLLVCMGEFGRTPVINPQAGRDHWSDVQSIVLAGAGIRAGCVYGASDRDGAYPADHPVSPRDLAATILHLLGVPAELTIADRTGRPLVACEGTPVAGVLS
jgi:hypothetical protein